ncbi:hypothetical protein [Guptibacillus hwajinpoensis]|uniref:Phage-Barnase-EndoU-ColicinE5/D-RelE like nuclease 3 domain-containing protein n=1 Tax=Guptibacillus hwajinpoensis TaxID=208199 RepID=A0ABU0K3I5_9BACL|nr:hypothetical protein [Alkalihalobacillus hemicentroti]MDQ0482948.1 hypothetical protein [Alkalihalobacillus hemicentroti]
MSKIMEKIIHKADQVVSITKAAGKGKHIVPLERFCEVFKTLPEVQKNEIPHLKSDFVLYTLKDGDVFMKMLERSDGYVLEIDVVEHGAELTFYRSYQHRKGKQKVTIPETYVSRFN